MLSKYFDKEEGGYRIRGELRDLMTFKHANLLKPLPDLPQMDLIFCRNVAIYFSREDRIKLYDKLASKLKDNGILIISSTESLIGVTDRFRQEKFNGTFYYVKEK
jgi:chemotaxis protein methyltransferase CheR